MHVQQTMNSNRNTCVPARMKSLRNECTSTLDERRIGLGTQGVPKINEVINETSVLVHLALKDKEK